MLTFGDFTDSLRGLVNITANTIKYQKGFSVAGCPRNKTPNIVVLNKNVSEYPNFSEPIVKMNRTEKRSGAHPYVKVSVYKFMPLFEVYC